MKWSVVSGVRWVILVMQCGGQESKLHCEICVMVMVIYCQQRELGCPWWLW